MAKNKHTQKKSKKQELAKENVDFFFKLIKENFCLIYNKKYLTEILKISQRFNFRLNRKDKLKFCKKCLCVWDTKNLKIRLNPKLKTKDYICVNCGYIKRFKYKN